MSDVAEKEKRDYEAEWDAETLARAMTIMTDSVRLKKAKKAAAEIVDERKKRADEAEKGERQDGARST